MMNKGNERFGMSGYGWNKVLTALEVIQDIIKGTIVTLGVLSATIADTVMGAISVSILFGVNASLYTKTPTWVLSTVLSLGASAFQIYLFALLAKRGIGFMEIINWKKLPKDVKAYVGTAGLLWFLDTLMDVAPVSLLVKNSAYNAIPELYLAMVAAVMIVVFILCGFSEILTSNMRGMLEASFAANNRPQPYTPRPTSYQGNDTGLDKTRNSPPYTGGNKKPDNIKKQSVGSGLSTGDRSEVQRFLNERKNSDLTK